jgi:hypothetical protein
MVVDHYSGLLCRMEDSGDPARKMKDLASSGDETLAIFGQNGRLKMEAGYDENLGINKYLRALKTFKRAS